MTRPAKWLLNVEMVVRQRSILVVRRKVFRQGIAADRRDLAAVRLEERSDDAPMLLEGFVELMQNAPVLIGEELLVCARGRICRDPL